eukprot:TRINITY_DN7813_c0_g1_i2.p1 TRINITY_DN7813_c0_g1~~TRINITY_DN7813_c0_g1_i2.p1  ORF type:complete len:1081 (+),score=218.66 TRINITY_DN7813_c0_g1_i2:191-3433(+)
MQHGRPLERLKRRRRLRLRLRLMPAKEAAAVKIQSVQRGRSGRNAMESEKRAHALKKEAAAIKIQSIQRGHALRKHMRSSASEKQVPVRRQLLVRPSPGGMAIQFKVNGLDYDLLAADLTMLVLFEATVKEVMVQQASPGLLPEHVRLHLSRGSVLVAAKLNPPRGVAPAFLRACFAGSEASLADTLKERISEISDINSFQNEAHGNLNVTELELHTGEEDLHSQASVDSLRSDSLSPRPFQAFPTPALARPAAPLAWMAEQWGGACSSMASSRATSRQGSPTRSTPHFTGNIATSALSRFRDELLRREGTFSMAWRKVLDRSTIGFITQSEFCDACRRFNYRGNIRDAWNELDADKMGKATLCELDWGTAETLGRFVSALYHRYGSIERSIKQMNLAGGRGILRDEFCKGLVAEGLAGRKEALSLFRMITSRDTMARPAVRAKDFQWLAKLSPHLPQPTGSRVQPGALPDSSAGFSPARTEFSDKESSRDEALSPTEEGLDSDRTPAGKKSPWAWPRRIPAKRGTSVPAPNQDASESEPESRAESIYERLHREAKDYHDRRKQVHEDAPTGALRKSASSSVVRRTAPPPESQLGMAIARLHSEAAKRKENKDVKAEKYLEELRGNSKGAVKHDKHVFERLLQPKKPPSRDMASKTMEPPSSSNKLKYKGPPPRPPPSGNIEQAAERLFKDHAKREQRKKDLRYRAVKEQEESDLQSIKKSVALVSREEEQEIVKRLHGQAKRKAKLEAQRREQLKKEAEDELQRLNLIRHKGKARPETFYRLHMDRLQREDALAERRKIKELEEDYKRKAESIHFRSAPNPEVFSRLYTSVGAGRQRRKTLQASASNEASKISSAALLHQEDDSASADELSNMSEYYDPVTQETTSALIGPGSSLTGALEDLRLARKGQEDAKAELEQARGSRQAMHDWTVTQIRELKQSRSTVAASSTADDEAAVSKKHASTSGVASLSLSREPESQRSDGERGGSASSTTPRTPRTPSKISRSIVVASALSEPNNSRRSQTVSGDVNYTNIIARPRKSLAAEQLTQELFGSSDDTDDEDPEKPLKTDQMWVSMSNAV